MNKMKSLAFLFAFATAGLLYGNAAGAGTLLVEQWQGGGAGTGGLAGADAAIAAGPADIAVFASIIDYTDDPAGFAGLIPGSSPWPLAAFYGVSGTGHTLNNNFAARISTNLSISTADTYWFRTYADDGVRLRIDGITVIIDNTYHPEAQLLGSIYLTPGSHALELIFFEGGGEASLEFSMSQGSSAGPFGHVGDFAGTSTSAVPEPASLALLGLGLFGLGFSSRRKRKTT